MALTVYHFVQPSGHDHEVMQRVGRNLHAALQASERANVVPVRWCPDRRTIVHAGPPGDGPILGQPLSGAASTAFFLVSGAPHLSADDAGRFLPVPLSTLVGDAQRRGLKSAAIFFDLTVTSADEQPPQHLEIAAGQSYGFALSDVDAVLPVSHASEAELRTWWSRNGVGATPRCKVTHIGLPAEVKRETRRIDHASAPPRMGDVVVLGTVRTSASTLAAIRAFKAFFERDPTTPSRLLVVGSIAPDLAGRISLEATTSTGRVVLLGHRSETETARLVRQARATVCVSRDGVAGLQVMESLWLGTPCICARTGAGAEAAVGGGCLSVDPGDVGEFARAFECLAWDGEVYDHLIADLQRRHLSNWMTYVDDVIDALEAMPKTHSSTTTLASIVSKNVRDASCRNTRVTIT